MLKDVKSYCDTQRQSAFWEKSEKKTGTKETIYEVADDGLNCNIVCKIYKTVRKIFIYNPSFLRIITSMFNFIYKVFIVLVHVCIWTWHLREYVCCVCLCYMLNKKVCKVWTVNKLCI